MTDLLLDGMTTYGAITLGIALLLGALGTPIPTSFMVIAAGAFARQGVINGQSAFLVGLGGAVIGDSLSYGLGRFAQGWVQRRLDRSSAWQNACRRFEQGGALTIYLTRFLFMPLAVPANLIAGGTGYSYQRFLTYDLAGEITWLVLYGGIGYAFGNQWQTVSQFINDNSGYVVGITVVGMGTYFVYRYLRQRQGLVPAAAVTRTWRAETPNDGKFSNFCNGSAQNLEIYPICYR